MVFQKITKDNVRELYPYLYACDYGLCDYAPMVLLLWGDYYHYAYALEGDALFLSMQKDEKTLFLLPIAQNLDLALKNLENYCVANDLPLELVAIPSAYTEKVADVLGLTVQESSEDDFDYTYLAQDLKELKGRRYNGQRNHLNRFRRDYPDAVVRGLQPSDKPRLEKFLEDYHCAEENERCNYDRRAVTQFVNNFDEFDFLGGVVCCKDEIVGLAFGDVIGDTLFVHVEKFLRGLSGLGETLNNGFAKLYATEKAVWINREEDMGEEGLRKAKKSYYPTMRKKYCAHKIK